MNFSLQSYKAGKSWITQQVPSTESKMWTYLITPWSTVLLDKLTGSQLAKKYPAIYGTRTFITAVTRAHNLSLFWASSFQYILPHLTSWRSSLISSSHLRLGLSSGVFPSDFPTKSLYTPPPPHTLYRPRPSRSSRFYPPYSILWAAQIIKFLVM